MNKLDFKTLLIAGFALTLNQGFSQTSNYKYVNTLFGAAITDHGNTIVGPQRPWGAISPGPDCSPRAWMTDGYDVDLPIKGFSQIHTNGAGGPGHYGNFLFSPQIGLNIDKEGHYSDKSDEVTKCGYYAVTLNKYKIRTEITANENSSMYRFTYPESNDASFVIDMSHNIPGEVTRGTAGYLLEGDFELIPEKNKIQGWGRYIGGWCSTPYTVYFTAEFSKPFKSSGVWRNHKLMEGTKSIKITEDIPILRYNKNTRQEEWNPAFKTPDRIGGFIRFDTKKDEQIYVKVGLSLNSIANAEKFLKNEIPDFNFEKVRSETEKVWEKELNRITINLGDNFKGVNGANDYEVFYTSLYHSMLMPRNRTADAPADWNKNVPFYDDFSALWDTYRTLHPFMIIVNPQLTADVINFYTEYYKRNGVVGDGIQAQKLRIYSLGRANQAFRYRWNQGSDAIDNIVGDAFVKKIPGVFDWNETYKMIKNNADNMRCDTYLENDRGWIPGDKGGKVVFTYEGKEHECPVFCNVSQALEMNLSDYCVAQVAKGLGFKKDYKRYMNRSNKWTETWNHDITLRNYIENHDVKHAFGPAKNLKDQACESIWDMKGWFGSKNVDGKFDGPGEYHESPLTDYMFFVPHNIPKVIKLMGGKENFIKRLDNTKIAAWNEPGFLALRAYYYAGRPDKAMPRIRETMKMWTEEAGLKYPGDDDSGAMSTWFMFSAMGFFPNAGTTDYFVNGPLYPEIEIKLGNGNTLKIIGKNASWDNYYVQSFKINGKSVNKTIISHEDIMNGGVFEFVMGNKPSKWGVK
jgi:predicted alpha-1,2-mannosidase